jgi:DNA repair protein RadC
VADYSDNLVERVRITGVRGASPAHLLAIGFSRRLEDANEAEPMGQEMLRRLGKIHRITGLSFADIQASTGMEDFEALRCLALIELGRLSGRAEKGRDPEIEAPEDIYELLEHLKYEKQEHFVVISLDAKNRVISMSTVHIGTLTMSIVGPREVFRCAVREGASSIIVAHNHPSGDPTPSPEDREVTRRLVEVGKSLDIAVADHIIIGDPSCVSFLRRGLL